MMKLLRKAVLVLTAVVLLKRKADVRATSTSVGQWSQWSSCSATCGEGLRSRHRTCSSSNHKCWKKTKESKHCFLEYCPSYLSWPRIHFSGLLVADVDTVNNNRCAYENEEFAFADTSKCAVGLQYKNGTHEWYKYVARIWNPDGSNQIYFVDTFVKSFCIAPKNCSTKASIVGLKVIESVRGVMVVLDVDWQRATEIWGLRIRIPGVMEGDFSVTSRPMECTRVDKIVPLSEDYYVSAMGKYKGKLLNVTWQDTYYQKLFKNATELSMVFIIDMYNELSLAGRITATIGPTSMDEPKQTLAGRSLQVTEKTKKRCPAPFHVHYKKQTLTLDLSYSVCGRQNGSFFASDLGKLDLAVMVKKKTYCKNFKHAAICKNKTNHASLVPRWITKGGDLTKRIGNDGKWYTTYGGLMDIDISHIDSKTLKLIRKSQIAIVDGQGNVYMQEFPEGIATGVMNNAVFRMNVGESRTVHPFVSSFGRPVKNAQVDFHVMKNPEAVTDCGRPSCNRTLGLPIDALYISSDHHITLTNASGMSTITLKAIKDPGKIRGCDLDGQIYPLQLYTRYKKGKKMISFANNGTNGVGHPADINEKAFEYAAHIYNIAQVKECPTWHDVKEIFIQYYNLYPVMWKSGIIDLHSYDTLRRKARMLQISMFETNFFHSRYMPISRDLSNSKRQLIWNWLKCGMKRTEDTKPRHQETEVCSEQYIADGIRDVQKLLHKAVMLELSTVPPYVTAWLSLKTEYGRNMEIAYILKTVFNEEMLHMTLAGNVLNAVGGVVNMTDDTKLPIYPTILASGDTYQLCPDMQVGLGPFSIGLVQDVFSAIEKPSDMESRQVMYALAEIWKNLPSSNEDEVSSNMKKLSEEASKLGKKKFSKSNIETEKESWIKLRDFALDVLRYIQDLKERNVGEFYTLIALRLTSLEACVRIKYLESLNKVSTMDTPPETIFTGDSKRQFNMSHWFQQSHNSYIHVMESMGGKIQDYGDYTQKTKGSHTRPTLFEVTDLKTALKAIVEIVYQGEGGSLCSPFVTEPGLYASERGRDDGSEISHYYRFQEIVNGRRIVKIKTPPSWTEWNCLNITHPDLCPSTSKSDESYCYYGDPITFYEDGVWPILVNPKSGHYAEGSKAHRLHHQFNLLYTRLLFCLEKSFGGKPRKIKDCMSIMYDLTITGKRLVQTPLDQTQATEQGQIQSGKIHGAPTWKLVREKPFRAGFPLEG